MRWRTMAAEEMQRIEQKTSKYGWWRRGNNKADNNNKKQQSTNVWWQRRRMCAVAEVDVMMAGKRWGTVVEVEEQLLCSGGEETASR
jgi:hypothetical protein